MPPFVFPPLFGLRDLATKRCYFVILIVASSVVLLRV